MGPSSSPNNLGSYGGASELSSSNQLRLIGPKSESLQRVLNISKKVGLSTDLQAIFLSVRLLERVLRNLPPAPGRARRPPPHRLTPGACLPRCAAPSRAPPRPPPFQSRRHRSVASRACARRRAAVPAVAGGGGEMAAAASPQRLAGGWRGARSSPQRGWAGRGGGGKTEPKQNSLCKRFPYTCGVPRHKQGASSPLQGCVCGGSGAACRHSAGFTAHLGVCYSEG